MKEKSAIIRVFCNKEGGFGLDETGKMPGRAAYLCKDLTCFNKAQKSKGLERSLKRAVPPEIYTQLTAYLKTEVEDFNDL